MTAKQLDPDTLANLRRQHGVPVDGPTEKMTKAWIAEENDLPAPAEVDEQPVDVEQQLRAEIKQVREAFDILLDERDQLARQADEVEQLRDQAAAEHREALRAIGALEASRRDRDRLAGLLEEATARINEMQREVEQVITTAEQLTATTAELTRHRHAWEWQPGLKAMPLPCACGRPWPRNRPPGVP